MLLTKPVYCDILVLFIYNRTRRCNMVKEFHLVARVLYTFAVTMFFSWISGLSFMGSFLGMGWVVFGMSFVFQYWVFQPVMRELKKPRPRLFFLIGVWGVSVGGMLFVAWMIPTFADYDKYGSVEALARVMTMWGALFSGFAAIFVAMTCIRRAWTRYGGLG